MFFTNKMWWIGLVSMVFLVTPGFGYSADVPADVRSANPWLQYDIRVDGMTCPFCVATSQKALKKIAGVRAVAANLQRGEMYVCVDDGTVFTDAQLKKLFLSKGFTFRSFTTAQGCSIDDEHSTHLSKHPHHGGANADHAGHAGSHH